MTSTLEKKDNNVVVLTIDVSPEDFTEALQRSFRKNASRFSIPGFRKGKAPMGIVSKYYGEGVLYDDAIEFAATPAYTAALAEHGFKPVSQPEMDILSINRQTGLKFTLTVTVRPDVTLGQYTGVEAVMPEYPVSDENVTREMTRMQERNSRMIPVEDRAVQDGDTANIDYEGFLEGVPFEGGKGASYDLKIGSKTFIPGFEEQLTGRKAGDDFEINVTFPEDYNKEELKGQSVVFKGKVNAVKIRELPALDDEFAKDVSEFDTLAEYRESLRLKLVESNASRAGGIFEENVLEAVTSNASADIPAVMVDQQVEHMIEEQKNQMHYQGIELEQYLGYIGQTLDTFKEQMRGTAENRVKTQLVLEAVAKAENITATPEEIDAEIERMAVQYGMKAEDLRERVRPEENGFVRDSVVHRKTVEFLTANAVKIAPPPEPPAEIDLPAGPAGEADGSSAGEAPAEPAAAE